MNFSTLSIRNPVPAIMLFALLTLAGLYAYRSNQVQDFPDIELPIVIVSAALPGAAPAQLETDVARKIEDAVAPLQGINVVHRVPDGLVGPVLLPDGNVLVLDAHFFQAADGNERFLHAVLHAFDEGGLRDEAADAEDDAEHGEPGAEFVRPDFLKSDADGV